MFCWVHTTATDLILSELPVSVLCQFTQPRSSALFTYETSLPDSLPAGLRMLPPRFRAISNCKRCWAGGWGEREWSCIIYRFLACFEFHPNSTVSALFQRLPHKSEWTSAGAFAGANTNIWPSFSWFTGPFSAEGVLILPITGDIKERKQCNEQTWQQTAVIYIMVVVVSISTNWF